MGRRKGAPFLTRFTWPLSGIHRWKQIYAASNIPGKPAHITLTLRCQDKSIELIWFSQWDVFRLLPEVDFKDREWESLGRVGEFTICRALLDSNHVLGGPGPW